MTMRPTALVAWLACAVTCAGAAQADEVGELRTQLKLLREQVQALSGRLQELEQRPPAVPAAGQAVTQMPGNLPGRSYVPPYTAPAPGVPGGIAPVMASPISSGGDKLKVSLSGQVNRAMIYGEDGRNGNLRQVDNNNSSTRIRLVGEGKVNDKLSGGVNLEAEFRANSSASTALTQDLPQSGATVSPTARQIEAYIQHPDYGGLRLGFGSTASYLTNEVDLSGTAVASYVDIAGVNGGFAFRQKGAALIPGVGRALVASSDGAFGPAVGTVFNFFGGLVRDNRVRYDSPLFGGFQVSTSIVDGGAADAALRYAADFGGTKFAAAVAFADARSRTHVTPSLYAYAGVPSGGIGAPAAAAVGATDSGVNGSRQYDGSASILFPFGLDLTFAGGYRQVGFTDPLGDRLVPTFLYGKIGWLGDIWHFGKTAIAADLGRNRNLQYNGDTALAYGIELVQTIEPIGTEVYVLGRRETLQRRFAAYEPIDLMFLGARVRF